MKAKQYTIAMLIALIFATASIQAQSARRPVAQDKKERARTSSTYKAKSTQAARKSQAREVRSTQARTTQSARKTQPASSNRGQQVRSTQAREVRSTQARTTQTVRKTQSASSNRGQQVHNRHANNKPVSMSTNNNSRSTYRKPNKISTADTRYSAPVKSKTHYNRAYYGGHHYHYAYPTTRVNIHYHHNTYVNRYMVLYYPTYGDIFWTRNMYRDYYRWYPGFNWRYNYGHRIHSISVWDAKYNLGEVAMVYGRVYASWYNNETDDYLLFFGGDFPYQQFTAVVPGYIARKFSWRPERFFLGEHVTITGLITSYDGSPEIVIKNRRQLDLY